MSSTPHVEFSSRAKTGEIRLNRPDALNALSLEMVEAIDGQLAAWAADPAITGVVLGSAHDKAFCVGCDHRAVIEAKNAGDRAYGSLYFRRFYQLVHRLATFPKATVAVMHGVTMGGGASLAMACKKRVATRQTYFALADCRSGFFPDGGAAHYLTRTPGATGMFLALTGVALRARGAHRAGLATHMIPEDRVALVTPLLVDELALPPPPSTLEDIEAHVNAIFGLGSLAEVMAILAVRGGEWAKGTLAELRKQSPTSLALTFRHLQSAKDQPLEAVLRTDFRLSQRLIDGHDFPEGVRAFVIDRDEKPNWQPADLAGVTPAALEALFAPLEKLPEWAPAGA
jgi:enoyl-CoA hydratase/carnithine racemase